MWSQWRFMRIGSHTNPLQNIKAVATLNYRTRFIDILRATIPTTILRMTIPTTILYMSIHTTLLHMTIRTIPAMKQKPSLLPTNPLLGLIKALQNEYFNY